MWLGRYLVIQQPFDNYVGASFTGDWDKGSVERETDAELYLSALCRYIVVCLSKLQPEIAMSSTHSKDHAISGR
jgi:hypothetical protein